VCAREKSHGIDLFFLMGFGVIESVVRLFSRHTSVNDAV